MGLETFCHCQTDCMTYPQKSEGVLAYCHYSQGRHFPIEKCTQNCMIFMLQGELLVNSDEYPGTTLRERQIILQAIGFKMELLALTEVEYIIYWFTELPLICKGRYDEILKRSEAPLTYTPLTAIPMLESQLKGLAYYLKEQPCACSKYVEVKCRELIHILMCYYPLYQASTFFYPISTYTESFQYFVMQNYEKVKNVEEFAHLGGYTTTTFRRLFKNLYGVPAYEWMLEKKRKSILYDLQYTKQRISAISTRYGFDSLSHFSHFCKDSFGDTPRSLGKRLANGEKITIITKGQGKDREEE